MTVMTLWGVFWFGCGWLACQAFGSYERNAIEKNKVWKPTNKVRR